MNMEQLEAVSHEAARDLVHRQERPLPATVVLPLPDATKVTVLEGFPDDDAARFDALAHFAADRMVPVNAPCYAFLAEATLGEESGEADVLMVVFGARQNRPRVAAAPLTSDGIGEFGDAEELDPTALPFLSPLQHAADTAGPPDVTSPILPG